MDPIRVLVAPFLERTVPGQCFWPFMRIAARAAIDGYSLLETPWQNEVMARERAVESLLADGGKHTHILMLDIDHNHREDIVNRLTRWVVEDPERSVVAALCFRRNADYEPLGFIKRKDGKGYEFPYPCRDIGLVEVARLGLGAALIHRRVFEALPDRGWFTPTYDRIKEGYWPDTSFAFSDRATGAGFKLWLDTTTVSPHLTDGWVDDKTLDSYMKAKEAEAKRRQKAARAAKGGKS